MNERNCANCFWESKNEDFGFKCCPYNPDYREGMRNDYFCEYFKERRYEQNHYCSRRESW